MEGRLRNWRDTSDEMYMHRVAWLKLNHCGESGYVDPQTRWRSHSLIIEEEENYGDGGYVVSRQQQPQHHGRVD